MAKRKFFILAGCFFPFNIIAFLSLLLILLSRPSSAVNIKLAWDPNTDPDLSGYKVYYSTTPRTGTDPKSCGLCGYSTVVPTGNVTTYTVSNLISGQTYYFSVTASDTSTNESGFSNEVNGSVVDMGQTYSYTFTTSPAGLQITVDGTTYTSPQTFSWAGGSSHAVGVSSPQSGGVGTQYVYSSWSDGGGQSHTITVPSSNATYTVNFTTQYSLTTSVSPSGTGTVSPAGMNWYNAGQSVTVSATANAGYSFSNWAGDLSGSTTSGFLTMNSPKSVMANFSQNQYTLTAGVSPSGSGSVTKNPNKSTYLYGEQVTVTATPNTGYNFGNWSGDVTGTTSPVTLTINGNKTITANFLNPTSLVVSPSDGLSASGTQGGPFSPSSRTYTLQNKGMNSLNWTASRTQTWVSLSMSGSLSPGGTVSVKVSINNSTNQLKAGSYNDTIVFSNTANANETVSRPVTLIISPLLKSYTVKTSPAGLKVTVDGTIYTAPQTFSWVVGSSHTLTAPSPQSFSGVQYIFHSWSFWSRRDHGQTITVPSSRATYTAYFTSQPASSQSVNSSGVGIGTLSWGSLPDYGEIGPSNGTRSVLPETTALPMIGELESPSEGKKIYGIKTIYGWALDGGGISKVNFYIDGVFVCDIPYGGLTEGLREAYPNYPDAERGGFALVWDYSNLSPGSHLVQIELMNVKGKVLKLGANVIVQQVPEEIIVQGGSKELLIPGLSLMVEGSTKAYDLKLEWSKESQAFEIIGLYPR